MTDFITAKYVTFPNHSVDEEVLNVNAIAYGISRIIIRISFSLCLSINVVITALRLANQIYDSVNIREIDNKHFATACVLLSWKLWEDREGESAIAKMGKLTKCLYVITTQSTNSTTEQQETAIAQWFANDNTLELRCLTRSITAYERLILSHQRFDILKQKHSEVIPHLVMTINKLSPTKFSDPIIADALLNTALGIILDFLHWPLSGKYDICDIAASAAFKSFFVCAVPLASDREELSDDQIDIISPISRSILDSIRLTYDETPAILELLR